MRRRPHASWWRADIGSRSCTAAAKAAPRRSNALGAMSTINRKLGRLDQAIAMLDRAREVDPDNLQHAFNRGTFHLESGEEEQAQELFETLQP